MVPDEVIVLPSWIQIEGVCHSQQVAQLGRSFKQFKTYFWPRSLVSSGGKMREGLVRVVGAQIGSFDAWVRAQA